MSGDLFFGEKTENYGPGFGAKKAAYDPSGIAVNQLVHTGPAIVYAFGAASAADHTVSLYDALSASGIDIIIRTAYMTIIQNFGPYGIKFDTGIFISSPAGPLSVWIAYQPLSE